MGERAQGLPLSGGKVSEGEEDPGEGTRVGRAFPSFRGEGPQSVNSVRNNGLELGRPGAYALSGPPADKGRSVARRPKLSVKNSARFGSRRLGAAWVNSCGRSRRRLQVPLRCFPLSYCRLNVELAKAAAAIARLSPDGPNDSCRSRDADSAAHRRHDAPNSI